jgi:hypothetical protein
MTIAQGLARCRLPPALLLRDGGGASGFIRSKANGVRLIVCAAPSRMSSAMASPVAGAFRMPQTLCPVATWTFADPGALPIRGRPSLMTGRKQACRATIGASASAGDSERQSASSRSIAPGPGRTVVGSDGRGASLEMAQHQVVPSGRGTISGASAPFSSSYSRNSASAGIFVPVSKTRLCPFNPWTLGRGSQLDARVDHGPMAMTIASAATISPSTMTPSTRSPLLRWSPATDPGLRLAPRATAAWISASVNRCGCTCAVVFVVPNCCVMATPSESQSLRRVPLVVTRGPANPPKVSSLR